MVTKIERLTLIFNGNFYLHALSGRVKLFEHLKLNFSEYFDDSYSNFLFEARRHHFSNSVCYIYTHTKTFS